jgi:predicted TIM-barrel fold metal-dependent hydrolase
MRTSRTKSPGRFSRSVLRDLDDEREWIAMKKGLKVFDADAHVVYPVDLWMRFLDDKYKSRVERQEVPGHTPYSPTRVDGQWNQLLPRIYQSNTLRSLKWQQADREQRFGDCAKYGFTGRRVADALAVEGVDVSVIYGPEFDMWIEGIDPDLQAAMARAYNRWGQEMRQDSGGRVNVSGPIPMTDVTRAVTEIQYAYDHLETRCFWMRPNVVNGRNLGDRYYDPIYELLQSLDCALGTHEFMGRAGPSAGSDRFTGDRQFVEWHAVVHPHEAQSAMVSMIAGGVFERFPKLRCAYMEAGCGWLPSWLHRIDEQMEMVSDALGLSMTATEYAARNCWVSTESEDRYASDVIRWLGDSHIVFETDFPHPETKYPHAVDIFLGLKELTLDNKRHILWDNAIDLYRFPPGYLPEKFVEAETSAAAE